MPIKVLVVDDSALIRQVLTDMFTSDPELMVIGEAVDGEDAITKIGSLKPDVVTLDVEMPKMGGLECLAKVMERFPVPIIMVSYLTVKGAETTIKALELGAIDFVSKPLSENPNDLNVIKNELIQKIKIASSIEVYKLKISKIPVSPTAFPKEIAFPPKELLNQDLLAIGCSTGGPRALYNLLSQFPKNFPLGIIVAQHMPMDFTGIFAERLDEYCQLEVTEAKTGDEIKPGKVLIAHSGYQTKILHKDKSLVVEVSDQPKLIFKPSVDYLFSSIADACQGRVLSILLTGMGSDGARGMKRLHDLGARTIAQDEQSCIVYGMPRVAVELGGVEFVESLSNIYLRVLNIILEK